jgi:hypothetical protein
MVGIFLELRGLTWKARILSVDMPNAEEHKISDNIIDGWATIHFRLTLANSIRVDSQTSAVENNLSIRGEN